MLKKLCIISSYYPSESDPFYSFVGTLVSAIADSGVECHVISPVSNMEKAHRAVSREEVTPHGATIHVYCPSYIIYPSRNILGFQTYRLTVFSKRKAIKDTYDKYIKDCDAIYSHFIDSGVYAAWLSKCTGIPAFVAVGESNITNKELSYTIYKRELHEHLRGVITVSSQLKDDVIKQDIFSNKTPIEVFPNGIDTDLFKPLDKDECRKKIGVAKDDFVVSFVGGFIKRKGFDKLQEVIKLHPDWKCILIGTGDVPVTLPPEQIVYCGRVAHENIPEYLSAADVFVLPTLAEGCCNAIVEAMGCGLPIVSSNRSFNDDILQSSYSIRVNPESIDEINGALMELEHSIQKRKIMSEESAKAGRYFSIRNRSNNILQFMELKK